MSKLSELLGDVVITPTGESVTGQALGEFNDVIGLYFSAHWCGPCRSFTPRLVQFYQSFTDLNPGKFDIVFVSSDKDDSMFNEYYLEMPWKAIPFIDRARKNKLSTLYGVKGIPCLVLLNGKTGEVITKDGRTAIMKDPTGQNFPWYPPTLRDLLRGKYVRNNGEETDHTSFDQKMLMLYFSAHWCPPCQAFTPKLVSFYERFHESKNFEIVFVSSDRDPAEFVEYMGHMPWLAIPYDDSIRLQDLNSHFDVQGIPSLFILDQELRIVNESAVQSISQDPDGVGFPWLPKPCEVLDGPFVMKLNNGPGIIYWGERASSDQEAADNYNILQDFASTDEKAGGGKPLRFFYAERGKNSNICDQVQKLSGIKGKGREICVCLLDLPSGTVYHMEGFSKDALEQFVAKWRAGNLQGIPISK